MLIAAAIALACWAVALVYGFGLGIERLGRIINQTPDESHWAAYTRFSNHLRDQWSSEPRDRKRFWDSIGELFEAGCFLLLGLLLFVIGLSMMFAVLPAWMALAILFGLAFLGASWWLFRRVRRNWRRLSTGHHRREAILSYIGIPVLAALGILMMYLVVRGIALPSPIRNPGGRS